MIPTRTRWLLATILSLAALFAPTALGDSTLPTKAPATQEAVERNLAPLDNSVAIELVLPTIPTTVTTMPAVMTTAPRPTTSTTELIALKPGGCAGWEGLIASYFPGEVGKACSVMMCESRGNPHVENPYSSASGLWQFLDSTWESVTGTPGPASQYSAETQTAAAADLRNSSGWGQWSCS